MARAARTQSGFDCALTDDFVMNFEKMADARRMLVDLKKRLARFGLLLHEDKTRLIEFGRLSAMAWHSVQHRPRYGTPMPRSRGHSPHQAQQPPTNSKRLGTFGWFAYLR